MQKQHEKALQKIFFDVRKEELSPLLKKGANLTMSKDLSHCIIATTEAGDKIVQFCSENYVLLSNSELMIPLVEAVEKEHNLEIKASHANHSKFFVDFMYKDKSIKLEKDSIFPRMRLYNSYDGSIRYSFGFGFHRLVCTNGLSVPIKGTGDTFKAMHTTAMGEGRALTKTMEAIEKFLKGAKLGVEGFRTLMENKHKSIEEAIIRMAAVAKETEYPAKNIEAATARLQVEKNMGYKLDDYLIYNAMNFAMYNNESKQLEHKKDKADNAVLQFMLTNKA